MSVFKFKEFNIIQEKSAMKVGTDGVLLGSWVSCENLKNILDIGSGTGLITLMLAQRNNKSNIIGIEIDKIASQEAQLNITNSDWQERIEIKNTSLQKFNTKTQFDLIVSNPPFYAKNISQQRRDIARRSNKLSFEELIKNTTGLLAEKGTFSVIIPKDSEEYFCKIATLNKLYIKRVCYIKGNETSEVKRVMLEFSFINSKTITEQLTIEKSRHEYTDKYIEIFYSF
jgi:tRNA1Val (adenine37-N6)-methyltransferase